MIPHGAKMSHFAVKKLWGLPCISHPARHQCSLRGPLKVAFRLFSSYLLHSESRLRFSFISVLLSPYFMRIQGQEKTIRKDGNANFLLSEMQLPPPVLTSTCQPWRADSPAAVAWRERASTLPFEEAIMKIKGRAGRLEVSFLKVWNIMKHHEIWWILQPLSLKVLNSKVSFVAGKLQKCALGEANLELQLTAGDLRESSQGMNSDQPTQIQLLKLCMWKSNLEVIGKQNLWTNPFPFQMFAHHLLRAGRSQSPFCRNCCIAGNWSLPSPKGFCVFPVHHSPV